MKNELCTRVWKDWRLEALSPDDIARHVFAELAGEIERQRGKLNFANREPPHCPSCDCGSSEPSDGPRCAFLEMPEGYSGPVKISNPGAPVAEVTVYKGAPEPGVSRLPVPGTTMTRLSDISDELIRQLRKQGMERMQAVFDGMRLRIDPWPDSEGASRDASSDESCTYCGRMWGDEKTTRCPLQGEELRCHARKP